MGRHVLHLDRRRPTPNSRHQEPVRPSVVVVVVVVVGEGRADVSGVDWTRRSRNVGDRRIFDRGVK